MTIFFQMGLLLLGTTVAVQSLPQNAERANYPVGFIPTVPTVENREEDELTQASATNQRPVTYVDNPYYQNNAIPFKAKVQPVQQGKANNFKQVPQQFRPAGPNNKVPLKTDKELEEEEEIEEPDRLSLLLPQTKFTCNSKNTGYYADEELGCEVFHYCQDNARHSWICPEGFTFHQVHLICMPPGGDNICEKSSKYHFVNEYLYKPVNLEEYQRKPNVSLKYSDRYYPQAYGRNANTAEQEYEEEEERPAPRAPVRFQQQQHQHQQASVPKHLLVNQVTRATIRPDTNIGQVFRSSNEVNIPLQQRRPQQQYLPQRYLNNEE